jgi:hypothetical protein
MMNDMNFDIDDENLFPILKTFDFHRFFKDQLVFFYFNLFKKNTLIISELSKKLSDVLHLLKNNLEKDPVFMEYLILFYRMIGHTRDIYFGKGEHDISYMFLMVFYDIFPVLAIYAMHRFVQPNDNLNIPYGSWRDIKYLCDYIRKNSPKKENHGLIQYCIDLMNSQFKKDYETWRFSVYARSRSHISNVSKWIPREHKKFHWLFNMLVLDWIKNNKPFLLNNNMSFNETSYSKAILKAKRLYRRKVSMLNKAMDTTEIKQCSQNWDEIDPKNIPCYTLMKQRSLIFGKSEKYQLCSKKIREHFDNDKNCSQYHGYVNKYLTNSYPVAFFVKEAYRLLKSCHIDNDSQKDLLNKQWKMFSKTICINGVDNVLPIIDGSFYMQSNDSESFYSAIGYSILIAERSSFGKRILMVDYQSTWIVLESETNFIDIIENIQNSIISRTNTLVNINNAMDLIVYSLLQSKSTNRFIKNMKLVFFSDFHDVNMDSFKKPFLKYGVSLPIFVFWNLSKQEIIEPINGVYVLSGISNGLLYVLCDLMKFMKTSKKKHDVDTYDNVRFILNNKRYDSLENYICSFY